MRILFLSLALLLTTLPLAGASHSCSSSSSSEAVGTVTIAESSYSCHYQYFGTGYYSESTYASKTTTIRESTTGVNMTVGTYSSDGEGATNSSSWEGGQNGAYFYGNRGWTYVGAGAGEGQSEHTAYGCSGSTHAGAYAWSLDGSTSAGQAVSRGTGRTLSCLPLAPYELL